LSLLRVIVKDQVDFHLTPSTVIFFFCLSFESGSRSFPRSEHCRVNLRDNIFGAVAGDTLFSVFQTTIIFLISYLFIWPGNANIFWRRCRGTLFSVFQKLLFIHLLIVLISHLSWQIRPLRLSFGSFIALFFVSSVCFLFGWRLHFLIFPRQEAFLISACWLLPGS